jgi:hypothetical protein
LAEPALGKTKLLELLALAHEHGGLDYKSRADLSQRGDLLEIVKDIAAMEADGGYLVIGADDGGRPTAAMTSAACALFDESRLRAKVKRYLQDPLELRTACHEVDGALIVIVYVGAHPDGFTIIAEDGQVDDKIVFRSGEVFVRHGTASERWRTEDFVRIKARLLERAVGVPELVPAAPSRHRVEAPRHVPMSPVGGLLFQRVFLEIENVGDAIGRIVRTSLSPENVGGAATVRAPAALAPRSAAPFEVNIQVADDSGIAAGADFQLRILYEGGGRQRELLTNIRYYRSGGFENTGYDVWEA